jgi:hypothetical protein
LSLMEQIQTLFLNSQVLRNEPQTELKALSSAKTLKAPTFDLPTFDDDELPTLVSHRSTSADSFGNLFNVMKSL